jgi:PAS domain S-box-containing protein
MATELKDHSPEELKRRIEVLEQRLGEAGGFAEGVRRGDVEALVSTTPHGPSVFTLVDAFSPFRTFVEQMHDGAATLGPEGIVLYCNPSLPVLLGTTLERVVGAAWHDLVDEQSADASKCLIEQAAHGRASGELCLRTGHGTFITVHITANSLREAGIGTICLVITDITERKRAAAEIGLLNTELEQRVARRTVELQAANKEMEAFSYSVSHDLRAPLRSLNGFSKALLEDFGDNLGPEGKGHLQRIGSAAVRMGQLIDALLDLSRVTRVEMTREPVDVSRMAEEVAQEVRSPEPGRAAEFIIAQRLTASTDPNLLRIILTNLLGNAWKFTGKRALARIEFGCAREGGTDSFFVRDNGAGFSMQYAAKLFGAFQRLHGAGDFPGTGIGLATVQRIVHRFGGRVWAQGVPDGGATFHFTLGPAPLSPAA